jgi:hypothetical protein
VHRSAQCIAFAYWVCFFESVYDLPVINVIVIAPIELMATIAVSLLMNDSASISKKEIITSVILVFLIFILFIQKERIVFEGF